MEKILNNLKKYGYKITENRKAVISFLLNAKNPVSLKEIANGTNNIDFTSIYRIINLYVKLKIVRKVYLGEKYLRYELEEQEIEHHHYVKCTKCGSIQKINYCIVDKIEKETNYKIIDHNTEFFGICPKCLLNEN